MHKTVVLNVVGLTPGLLGSATPRLTALVQAGAVACVRPVLPAVTCTAQTTYLTGAYPVDHGAVGNGWYFRDDCDIRFWRQSNKLVHGAKLWERARELDPSFTCANLFWWFNMYSSADYAVTPRPMYLADGRKLPDIWTQPAELRCALQSELGQFPLFSFWGPATSIRATRWIADAAVRIDKRYDPTLTLVYLPHLDYGLQRIGPDDARVAVDLREVDAVCGGLIDHYRARGAQVVVLSEYGIVPVSRPVHLNRALRQAGLLTVREELGLELLDAGASAAFTVADHQVAHVYVNDPDQLDRVRAILENTEGVAQVLDADGKRAQHLDHPRAGELVAVAAPDAWFTYYYWLDDRRAPDFARTVDIHRKPGYDPVELFTDPRFRWPKARIGTTLLMRRLGFRTLLDVISLDASLVRGSHGLVTQGVAESPLFVTDRTDLLNTPVINATDVCDLILRHLVGDDPARASSAPGVRPERRPS